MATKKELEILVEELKAQLAATAGERDTLRARLDTGLAAYKVLRGQYEEVREQLKARRVVFVKPQRKVEPVVTRFYRNGQLWEKTRVGNVATERLVEPRTEFHVVAGKYDGDEENCKFADVCATREAAEALLATVSDYPWSRIEERTVA